MGAEPLFTIRSASGSLVDVAEQLVAELAESSTLDAGDRVLSVMIVKLAETIDAAGRSGRASAAAMAARELREAIADIRDRHAASAAGSPEDEFAHFRDFMIGLVDSSGDE